MPSRGFWVYRTLKVLIVLVYCVVCKMDKRVVKTFVLILLRCKTSKAFFQPEHAQRLNVGHKNVDSEVKFVLVNEVWILDVLLNNQVLTGVDVVKPSSDKYTFALRHGLWLHNEIRSWVLLTVALQLLKLVRKVPGLGKELKVIRVHLLHPI